MGHLTSIKTIASLRLTSDSHHTVSHSVDVRMVWFRSLGRYPITVGLSQFDTPVLNKTLEVLLDYMYSD